VPAPPILESESPTCLLFATAWSALSDYPEARKRPEQENAARLRATFQHANIRLILGPLNWVFSTNELHRWQHADRPEEANRNYGGVLVIWDLVFGTYLRRPGARPLRYGLFPGNERYPRASWWRQISVPFA
jgi:hypothetical protein